MEWHWISLLLTCVITVSGIGIAWGISRQKQNDLERRVVRLENATEGLRDLERRMDRTEDFVKEQTKILAEIRDRVVALDEWRKLSGVPSTRA